MVTQFKIFPIPINCPGEKENQLNQFLSSHKIISINREFINDNGKAYICFEVEYITDKQQAENTSKTTENKKSIIDYKEILSHDDFSLYLQLKAWRKSINDDTKIPLYAIFNNEQLAKICQLRPQTKESLKKIDGVGDGKIEKYADAVLKIVSNYSSTNKKIDKTDTQKQTKE
ncbi:HRDC domain-containing protein [Candidatus Magnetomorum sp. HK-1]|nr:HRDC domain-containing protein [Candidatus Magnetomorum sp. HK-1]